MHRLIPDLLNAILGLVITLGQHWIETIGGIVIFVILIYIAKIIITLMQDD